MPLTAKAAAPSLVQATLHYLDVVVLVVATAPALVLGVPALGYLVATGAWILQRVAQQADRHFTGRVQDPVRRAGANLFEAFGRIWLLAGAIVVSAVIGGRKDGLTAALVVFVAYSIAFVGRLIAGANAAAQEQLG